MVKWQPEIGKWAFIFLLFWQQGHASLVPKDMPQEITKLLVRAERAYASASFNEALDLYTEAYEQLSASSEDAIDIASHIAQCLYELGDNKELINDFPKNHGANPHHRFLYALSLSNLDRPNESIEILESLLHDAESSQVRYQLALLMHQKDESERAKTLISGISIDEGKLYILGQLLLARIHLHQHEPELSLETLTPLNVGTLYQHEHAYLLGESHLQLKNFRAAEQAYDDALPEEALWQVHWWEDALIQRAYCLSKIANQSSRAIATQDLQEALRLLNFLRTRAPSEKTQLAYARALITTYESVNDIEARDEALELLSKENIFISASAKTEALQLHAKVSPSYGEREHDYRRLTSPTYQNHLDYGYFWSLRAQNDYLEGLLLQAQGDQTSANGYFNAATTAHQKAIDLFKESTPTQAIIEASRLLSTYLAQDNKLAIEKGLSFAETFTEEHPQLLKQESNPGEFLYLHLQLATKYTEHFVHKNQRNPSESLARQLIDNYAGTGYANAARYILATQRIQEGHFVTAQGHLQAIIQDGLHGEYAGNAFYWLARCDEELGKEHHEVHALFERVYKNYPNSEYAAEAYFHRYTLSDYLQGGEDAIKHLEDFENRFPSSPLVAHSYLLIGLDHKRPRHNISGKSIRVRDWKKAIDAFQRCEEIFNEHIHQKMKNEELATVCLRARYERAMANLAIANGAQGAKRDIYIEYAIDLFRKLIEDLQNPDNLLAKLTLRGDSYPAIIEEAHYGLAIAHIKAGQSENAGKVLNTMTESYRRNNVTRGYYLSRVRYQQAHLAIRQNHHREALKYLNAAEDANKGQVLSHEERLDLWIQRSHCYRELGRLDEAMLQLSQAINDEAVSSLRLKAMLLRAEIYQLQGRSELAQKQLNALAKMSGYWATQAQERLKQEYHYD